MQSCLQECKFCCDTFQEQSDGGRHIITTVHRIALSVTSHLMYHSGQSTELGVSHHCLTPTNNLKPSSGTSPLHYRLHNPILLNGMEISKPTPAADTAEHCTVCCNTACHLLTCQMYQYCKASRRSVAQTAFRPSHKA